MSRRVFISFLGANRYVSARYKFDSGKVMPTSRFIQESLLDNIASDWTENDRIFIYLTSLARKNNWEDTETTLSDGNKDVTQGLKTILMQKRYASIVQDYSITEGINEDSQEGSYEKGIWDIFEIVYKNLQPGDEVYFDVTHSFRYMPMFSLELLDYSQFMKDVKVRHIYYGAFEVLGNPRDVEGTIPEDKRIAPIVDLINIIRLQQYTAMANSMKKFGKLKAISNNLVEEDSVPGAITGLSKSLVNLEDALSKCDMERLKSGKLIKEIRFHVQQIKMDSSIPTPGHLVLDELVSLLIDFSPEDSYQNVEASIAWVRKFEMIQQAYTMAEEYVVSVLYDFFEERNPFEQTDTKRKEHYRLFLNAICTIKDNNGLLPNKLTGYLKKYEDLTRDLFKTPIIQELRSVRYGLLSNNRNELNHASAKRYFEIYVNKFDEVYPNCLTIIHKYTTHADQSL